MGLTTNAMVLDLSAEQVVPDVRKSSEPHSPQAKAYSMVYESGLAAAKEWSQLYLNEAVTYGDTVASSFWQAVVVRVAEIEIEQSQFDHFTGAA